MFYDCVECVLKDARDSHVMYSKRSEREQNEINNVDENIYIKKPEPNGI
jgi:hypothetical protein